MIRGRRPLRASLLLWAARSVLERGRERWARLSADEQRRRLLTASRGRRRNLSEAEQRALRGLLRKSGGRADEPAPAGAGSLSR